MVIVSRRVSGDEPVGGLGARGGIGEDSARGERCSGWLIVFGVRDNPSVCLLQRLVCQWAREEM